MNARPDQGRGSARSRLKRSAGAFAGLRPDRTWAPPVRASNAPLERLPGFARIGAHSIASNSSMNPAIMPSPLSQKPGSLASKPNGASRSLWCLEPPAFSISKYFS